MNIIERTLTIKAPQEKVWGLIGTPEGFATWFKTRADGNWSVGSDVMLTWPSGSQSEIRIVAIDPQHKFAFSWHPGESATLKDFPEEHLTTSTFNLRTIDGGTELHLVETGFENIPEDRRLKALGLNNEGWDEELENIRTHAEA